MKAGQEILLVRWTQVSSALETAEAALSRALQASPDGEAHKALRLRVIQLQQDAQRASEAMAAARAQAGPPETHQVG